MAVNFALLVLDAPLRIRYDSRQEGAAPSTDFRTVICGPTAVAADAPLGKVGDKRPAIWVQEYCVERFGAGVPREPVIYIQSRILEIVKCPSARFVRFSGVPVILLPGPVPKFQTPTFSS